MADSFIERNEWAPDVLAAVVLFILGTCITLYFRRRDRDSKHLDYQVLSDTPIVTSRDKPEILKVMYGATEVKNPHITEVRFKNTGKQVIESDDFLAPMAIVRKGAKVLDFNDVDQSESDLIDSMDHIVDPPSENHPVGVNPKTLNRNDWFTIQVIYDVKKHGNVVVSGRIKGQTRAPRSYQDREPLSVISKLLIGSGLISIAFGVYFFIRAPEPLHNGKELLATGMILVGGVVYGTTLPRLRESLRRIR